MNFGKLKNTIQKSIPGKHFSTIKSLRIMQRYPGLKLPLREFNNGGKEFYPLGMHGNCFGATSDILPVREVAMMAIMEQLTDKESWEKKIFDDVIIAKWRKEALEYPDLLLWRLATGGKVPNGRANGDPVHDAEYNMSGIRQLTGIMSNAAFDHCVDELRNKSRYYEKTGLIPTLDAYATVVKSDSLISSDLHADLLSAFKKLKGDQAASPDWHPNSGDMVQDLVHPSMYPLVYGKSRVFQEEVVGVEDAIVKWAGKGDVIKKNDSVPAPNGIEDYVGGSSVPPYFWSDTYQWLPSNVELQDDGSVRFTSYINNLHPTKYPEIYRTIEKFIETVLPAWDQCLNLTVDHDNKLGAGRVRSRFSQPEDPDDDVKENWCLPSHIDNVMDVDEEDMLLVEDGEYDEFDDEEERRWHYLRIPVQPEPKTFGDGDGFYAPKDNTRLARKFKDSGLQIIVKMASIELTPDKPEFPIGGWHVEGQMNEHICATALYYLDSENITSNDLSFRMQTSAYINDEYSVGQDAYHWMEAVYGTGLGSGSAPCLQNYGKVETREGRLLAFPNVFQHRVSPFHLTDPTKPGHRRFIALWLVDPHTRIISTANVPPQQQDWWARSLFPSEPINMTLLPVVLSQFLREERVDTGSDRAGNGELPSELMRIVREHFKSEGNSLLMSEEEAKEHRNKLMEIRSAFHVHADQQWHHHSYNFCEH